MKFYVYRHIRLDKNLPFYIGVGTKQESYKSFETEYRRAHDFKKRNVVWKRVFNLTPIRVEIIFESNNPQQVLEKEMEFIKLYGRKKLDKQGILVNRTLGGDGTLGMIHSKESRLKMSKAKKGITISDERKKVLSENWKGKNNPNCNLLGMSKEHREKLRQAKIGKKVSLETKLKISKSTSWGLGNSAKEVMHLETGIFYTSLKEACYRHNIKYGSEITRLQRNLKTKHFCYISL
jgi:hypothetical protein